MSIKSFVYGKRSFSTDRRCTLIITRGVKLLQSLRVAGWEDATDWFFFFFFHKERTQRQPKWYREVESERTGNTRSKLWLVYDIRSIQLKQGFLTKSESLYKVSIPLATQDINTLKLITHILRYVLLCSFKRLSLMDHFYIGLTLTERSNLNQGALLQFVNGLNSSSKIRFKTWIDMDAISLATDIVFLFKYLFN